MIFQPTFGSAMQNYFVSRVREISEKRKQCLASLKTREDALKYIAEVKAKISRSFRLPQEKSPLNATVTGTVKGDGFRVEKVIYYSRPDFPVTANLYLPDTGKPAPGVLYLCGHNQDGKSSLGNLQSICHGLARQGYAVLAIDPIGQGERLQFIGMPNNNSIHGSCTREHNMLGKQMLLNGDYFGNWRAWDAIRGLDYLLSRPEIDSSRVSVTGCSGGGTMTALVNFLDDRLATAASSCYITSWRRNIENELPADAEQIPPGMLGAGCEMGDFIIARAPRPFLILAQRNDFFDARGSLETFEEARHIYRLLGEEDKIQLFTGLDGHGLPRPHREATYRFFNSFTGKSEYLEPESFSLFTVEQMNCTPQGQVEYLPGRKLVRDLISEEAGRLAASRKPHTPGELKTQLMEFLNIQEPQVPYYRILRPQVIEGGSPRQQVFSRFALEIEPAIPAVLKLMAPTSYFHLPQAEKALLYIPHMDSVEELSRLAPENDVMTFGLDIRGIGETLPLGCDQDGGSFFAPYRSDYHFDACHLLLGDSFLGAKVRDILGALALLDAAGYRQIHLTGNGMGAISAALAALIYGRAEKVTLNNAPPSWNSMQHAAVTLWPQSCMPYGILRETDLPEIYAAIPNIEVNTTDDHLLRFGPARA